MNKLNAYMDHCWDGFYTCQKRLQRFHGIIQGGPGSVYNVTYTGSPAKKQVFHLRSTENEAGTTIRIFYPSAESRNIVKEGKIIEFNQWDELQNQYGEIRQTFCGENRYIGIKNIFEFYITPGCVLEIMPRDAIQVMVRLEWSFADFFASGGTTKFVDRLASSLGIHGSEIKIVSVYEGPLSLTTSSPTLFRMSMLLSLPDLSTRRCWLLTNSTSEQTFSIQLSLLSRSSEMVWLLQKVTSQS